MNASSIIRKPTLSLVIPAYNESHRIEATLHKLIQYLEQEDRDIEVVLVIEKSQDDTVEKAIKLVGQDSRFKVIANSIHRGKGFAVKSGVFKARGDIILYMDADLATPLLEIEHFLATLESQPEISLLIGNRIRGTEGKNVERSPLRSLVSKGFRSCVQVLIGGAYGDTQCGFKALRREAALEIFSRQRVDGFIFDVELLLWARILGFRVKEQAIEWKDVKGSTVRIVRDSARMFRDLLSLWVRLQGNRMLSRMLEWTGGVRL